jgi:hypothetical protein
MRKKIIMVAAITAAAIPVAASANALSSGLNSIGVYGQIVGTPSTVSASDPNGSITASGGNTEGGVGVTLSGVNSDLFFTHLGFDYGAGPAINGGSYTLYNKSGTAVASGSGSANVGGHTLQFNARLGKGFAIGENAMVGPYVAYQYGQFTEGLDGYKETYDNNALGGGLFAAVAATNEITLSGHVGYLAGISASASGLTGTPSSNVLQVGGRADYRFDTRWSGFVGVAYDRYSASDSVNGVNGNAHINDIRGIFGLAYHY